MNRMTGEQSICFEKPPYIRCSASVVGKKEGEGPLGNLFDLICEDPMLGEENWEKAESMLQVKAAKLVLEKAGQMPQRVRYIFAGDLLGQLIATSFGVQELEIPLFGLYGACSTCGETLSLAAMTVNAGYADQVLAITSSHFGSAEKQFRFPLEYGNQRPLSATWTVTGSGAFLLSTEKTSAALIPTALALKPPMKIPRNPFSSTASFTPFHSRFPKPGSGTDAPAPANSTNG